MKNVELRVGCMTETPIFIAGEINQDLFNGDPITGFAIMDYVSNNLSDILVGLGEAFQEYQNKGRLDLTTSHDVAYGYIKKVIEESVDFSTEEEKEPEVKKTDWEKFLESDLTPLQECVVKAFESAKNIPGDLLRLSAAYPEMGMMFVAHLKTIE